MSGTASPVARSVVKPVASPVVGDVAGGYPVSYFVDAVSGNDSNSGSSAEPFATLSHALGLAASGEIIGLKGAQTHYHDTTQILRSVVSYGNGNAKLDCRQIIGGLTWTFTGGVWKTTVTFRNSTTAGGLSANTTFYGLWHNEEWVQWQVGGADIAANIANVVATENSWTIHKTGSTNQDPRSDSGTSFDVYVRLSGDTDPNSEDLRIADVNAFFIGSELIFDGIDFIGANSKDSIGGGGSQTATLRNCTHIDFGQHGSVGYLNYFDYTASGKSRPGYGNATVYNRTGGGINLFTGSYYSTGDVRLHNVDLENATIAIYGHGSGNQGYRSIIITGTLRIANSSIGINFDVTNGVTRVPFINNGIECSAAIYISGVTKAFIVDSDWSFFGGGMVSLGPNVVSGTVVRLVEFIGTESIFRLKDTTIENTYPISIGRAAFLYTRTSGLTHTTPLLELDNVQDISVNTNRFMINSNDERLAHLILKNGTVLKNLHSATGQTHYPAELTVEAGCTFGLGNRTGPEIESALTSASVPHSISHDTTIVALDNSVLSSPGW